MTTKAVERVLAETQSIENLLGRIPRGELRIARFQRPFRWTPKNRIELFDSIVRGFPIGTLLFWRRSSPAMPQLTFQRYVVPVDASPAALWIVDGQQRVSTLADALLYNAADGEKTIHYDLITRQFSWARRSVATPELFSSGDERLLPLSELLDSRRLIRWMSRHLPNEELQDRAIDVGKRLREYSVPAYVVEASDEAVLREVFARINSAGTPLLATEVFSALHDTIDSTASGPTTLADLADLTEEGFGVLANDIALKALLAVAFPKSALEEDLIHSIEASGAPDLYQRTRRALEKTARFLREDAAIPHAFLIPYSLIVWVLARFFDAFPEPFTRSLTLLRRWVWRGSIAQRLTGSKVGIRAYLRCVRDGDEHGTVQALLGLLSDAEPSEMASDLSRAGFQHAWGALQGCAMLALEPRDLISGEVLAATGVLLGRDKVDLPIIVRGRPGIEHPQANRLMHPYMPAREMQRVLRETADLSWLASHGVSAAAQEALRHDDVEGFLELREDVLRAHTQKLFARMAEWGADDSPPLTALLLSDGESHASAG